MSTAQTPNRPVAGALFETWLERRATPLLEGLFVSKVSKLHDAWTWEFCDLNAGLELCLRETLDPHWSIELFVRARRDERVWGLAYWSSIQPVRIGERWEDLGRGDLLPDAFSIEPCPCPQMLIERELFAPFALWVDEVLSQAQWLLFYGGAYGAAMELFPSPAAAHRDDLIDALRLRGSIDAPAPFPTLCSRLVRNRLRLKSK